MGRRRSRIVWMFNDTYIYIRITIETLDAGGRAVTCDLASAIRWARTSSPIRCVALQVIRVILLTRRVYMLVAGFQDTWWYTKIVCVGWSKEIDYKLDDWLEHHPWTMAKIAIADMCMRIYICATHLIAGCAQDDMAEISSLANKLNINSV